MKIDLEQSQAEMKFDIYKGIILAEVKAELASDSEKINVTFTARMKCEENTQLLKELQVGERFRLSGKTFGPLIGYQSEGYRIVKDIFLMTVNIEDLTREKIELELYALFYPLLQLLDKRKKINKEIIRIMNGNHQHDEDELLAIFIAMLKIMRCVETREGA